MRVIAEDPTTKARVVCTPKGLIQITEIPFDAAFFADMFAKVHTFWRERYVPAMALKEANCLDEGEVSPSIDV